MNLRIQSTRLSSGIEWMTCALALLLAQPSLYAAEAAAPASLLDRHLAQLPPAAAQPAMPTATAAAVAAAARHGQQQTAVATADVELRRGRAELLAGLPAAVLATAKTLAADETALQQALADGPSLPLLLALAAERNPAVQAAEQNWRAECARYSQADYLQDLLRQYRGYVREIDTAVGPQPLMMDEGGLFVGSDVLSLKGQLIAESVAIARLNYLSILQMTLRETAMAAFEVQYFIRAVTILRSNRALAAQMHDNAQAQLAAGQVSQADVLKIRSMLEMLDNRIAQDSQHRLPQRRAALNALLNLPPDTPWGPLASFDGMPTPPAAADAIAQYLAHNQDLLRARLEATRMQTMLRMAELMLAPAAGIGAARLDLNRGAEAGPTRRDMATFPTMPSSQPPSAGYGANLGYLEELRRTVQRMRLVAQSQASQGAAETRVRLHAVAIAARTLKTLETTLPQRQQAFELLKTKYAAGQVPLVEYLDAGRTYFDDLLMQAEAQMEFNRGWSDLEEIQGRSLAAPVAAN